jgi:insertion element IS1 protein InsB
VAFCEWKKNKVWIWKAVDLMSKRAVGWELGGRDDGTLKRLLDKVGIKNHTFITDDFEAYHRCIPQNQLFTGKDLTFPIEQDNSNTRHYLARFRRKSKVTSRSLEMVDLSLLLLYHFSDPNFQKTFMKTFKTIFS